MIARSGLETRARAKQRAAPPQIVAGHEPPLFAFFDGIMDAGNYCNRLQQLDCGNVRENDKSTKPLKKLFYVVVMRRLRVFVSLS
jgi:hypothetical protein